MELIQATILSNVYVKKMYPKMDSDRPIVC